MSNALSKFIVRLGENPLLRTAFTKDREAVMADCDLSDNDKQTLREGGPAKIYVAAGADGNLQLPKIIIFPNAIA